MNDQQLDDLKQFIQATVSQSEARLRDELASKADLDAVNSKVDGLSADLKEVRSEMRDGFAAVGEAIDGIHTQLDDHERRITRAEGTVAEHSGQLRRLDRRVA